jgi:hypothetical protein
MLGARTVLLIVLLLAGSLPPPGLAAQTAAEPRPPPEELQGFVLEQNYPEQVDSETWIPFTLFPSLFENGAEVRVTIRIHNSLNQVRAIPEAIDHPSGRGTRVVNLVYQEPGRKVAYWDGRDTAGRRVPSGVYYIQMVVGEETKTRKLVVLNTPRRRRNILPW